MNTNIINQPTTGITLAEGYKLGTVSNNVAQTVCPTCNKVFSNNEVVVISQNNIEHEICFLAE